MSVDILRNLDPELTDHLKKMVGFLSFQQCFLLETLLKCKSKIVMIISGNQAGKTASIMMYYILRIMGLCPIESKNIRPSHDVRTFRFASQRLPLDKDEGTEVKNTTYIQFKQFLPPELIKKDITVRKPVVTLYDPQGGPDIMAEFVSYGEDVQSQAGHQRRSVFEDEEAPKAYHEEQIPRLLASDGDIVIGLTPANYISWTFDSIYNRAGTIYNSPFIIDYMKRKNGTILAPVQTVKEGDPEITVIRAATDDNPIYKDIVRKINEREGTNITIDEYITRSLVGIEDRATMETRRYGVYHQISGIIFEDMVPEIVISRNKYFPQGIPHDYVHARGIDYHEHTNWACGWIALSQQNEAFIYNEYNPSPDTNITLGISHEICQRSKDYKYSLNLIDPRAAITQINTGLSCLDDLNRHFFEFMREGIGTGGYWQTWDSKNQKGKDAIKERLRNSRICGRPFNNKSPQNGKMTHLPTLWILDNCPITINMFKNWRWEQWESRNAQATKEEKNKEEDRNSHFPRVYEAIFKHPGFSMGRFNSVSVPYRESPYNRMFRQGARV